MWSLELEPEVAEWLDGLPVVEFAAVAAHVERLERQGNLLRMPASRALGAGLFELRFDLARAAWRITYYYPGDRRIVLLTVFRKQRQNERTEVQRARWAMQRCISEQHTPDEEND